MIDKLSKVIDHLKIFFCVCACVRKQINKSKKNTGWFGNHEFSIINFCILSPYYKINFETIEKGKNSQTFHCVNSEKINLLFVPATIDNKKKWNIFHLSIVFSLFNRKTIIWLYWMIIRILFLGPRLICFFGPNQYWSIHYCVIWKNQ